MTERIVRWIFGNQWLVIGTSLVVLLIATELGFRRGMQHRRQNDQDGNWLIGAIQAASLGLLGLLLGFTFAMSERRYEARRDLVLEEANAIGTTYLRAALLPGSHQRPVEDLLREYVDARISYYNAGDDLDAQAAAERVTARLQRALWSHAVASAKEAPDPISATFIETLNQTIDLDAARVNALVMRVPGAVWILVITVAAFGCYMSGYAAGVTGVRSAFTTYMLPLLIAVVITLIADLDRSRGGLIQTGQQPMYDLKASLTPSASN